MQAYPQPQPPAQNTARQKLWWLIYGLSFGVGIFVFDAIYTYVASAIFAHWMITLSAYEIINALLNTLYLLFFAACLVVGILVARKTRRAGLATLASLLVGLCFILGDIILQILVETISRGMYQMGTDLIYTLCIDFPATCLGIYVGFLSGLIGRTTEKSNRTIGIFYAVGIILVSTTIPFLGHGFYFYSLYIDGFDLADVICIFALTVLGSICGMTAWIMTLIQYARAQSWGAFTLTFFFSGIMILVYLIAGVPPKQPAQYVVLQPGGYAPGAVAYQPMQPAPAQPSQPDAVAILQQRFARGEINEETYRQMLATLTSPPQR